MTTFICSAGSRTYSHWAWTRFATKLEHQGIDTTVANYVSWPTLAEEAAAEYKSGRVRTIILVGHSSGAVAVTSMATRLSELGVPVKLAIGLDPTSHMTASGHIDRYVKLLHRKRVW